MLSTLLPAAILAAFLSPVGAQVVLPEAPTPPAIPAPIEPAVAADLALGPDGVLDHYVASQRELEADLASILAIPDDQRTFANTIKALETASARHDDVVRPLEILGSVSADPETRKASKLVEEDHGEYATALWSRRDLYRAVSAYAAKGETLTGEDKELLETITGVFEDSGVHLPADQSKRFNEIQERLAALATQFQSHIDNYEGSLELTLDELKGLPQDHIDRLARTDEGKHVLTLDFDDYDAFMKHAHSSELRRKLELKNNTRAAENAPILGEMLRLRDESAKLMGYPTYADWELSGGRMMHSPREVLELLNRVWNGIREKADAELKAMLELKKRDDPSSQAIESHEKDYYTEKLRKQRFDFSSEEVKQYFPTDRVVEGVMDVYQQVLGVRFAEVQSPKLWDPEVRLFEVRDAASGERIGHFYLDLFPRKGKYKWFAVFDVVKGRELENGGYQEPTAMMIGNFSRPSPGKPSLLSHDEVETFFHEFGHLMHETLTKARYASHAGINVAQDFLEAPSQMLENFAWDREILDRISGHWQDPSRKLPPELFEKMVAARSFNRAMKYTRQLAMSMIDMMFHMSVPANTSALFNQMMSTISLVPYPFDSRWEGTWDHMLDYAAGYYGYLRAEITSDDLFDRFKNEGLLNPSVGMSYRREILERGSSRPEEESIRAFLGREPSDEPFMKRLLGGR